MRTVVIDREPVELFKILKFEGLASSGAEAKLFIGDGMVFVNNEVETRKRRKMYSGDVVQFAGQEITLEFQSPSSSDELIK